MKNISSLDNKIIKETASLKESKNRKKSGLFLVDGKREIELALKAGFKMQTLFFAKDLSSQELVIYSEEEEIIEVNEIVFKKMAYKENPDGYLAIFKQKKYDLKQIKVKEKSSFLILEGVEKPGNLGAIIRSAEAFGLDAMIINDSPIDIYNPNVIRASEGLVFFLPIVKSEREKILSWLKENEIKSFAAATQAEKSCNEIEFPNKTAIILGSEAHGLSEEWLKNVDEKFRIPMKKGIDSLNLSVSAAIMIYELRHQQDFSGLS